MPKLRKTTLKKHLNQFTKEELVEQIMDLVKQQPMLEEYYISLLTPDEEEILNKYKKIIDKQFGDRGEVLRYPVIKKAIKDFSKVSANKEQIAEIMVFTVECGVDFTRAYGDIDERFYLTVSSIYRQALEYIVKNDLEEKFVDRCRRVMERSGGIGWGFGDAMVEFYYDYLGHMEEEEEED